MTKVAQSELYEAALRLRNHGLSIIPVGKNKIPLAYLLPVKLDDDGNPVLKEDGKPKRTWDPYKIRLASEAELKKWFASGKRSVAIIGGKVSGQLCQMDFDDHNQLGCMFDEWKRLVGEADANLLLAQLVIHKTPGGGYHVRWRVDTNENLGKGPIAKRFLPNMKSETIIESQSEGAYALCPPSTGYERIQGSLFDIPVIKYESHLLLVSIAKSLHTAIEKPSEKKPHSKTSHTSDGLSAGDDFNKRGKHRELLEKHEWQLAHASSGKEFWKRTGSGNAWGGTFNVLDKYPDEF